MMTVKRFFFIIIINTAIICFCVFTYLIIMKMSIVIELYISTYLMLSMTMIIDLISLVFVCTVLTISSLVMLYSIDYMKGENENKFSIVMILFISFMVILCLSGNLFWVMVGWDGLGVTSFVLIMFFQNWKSFNSAMVTFMCNRMGDLFIMSTIAWLLSSNILFNWMTNVPWFVQFMLVVTALSKSAQIPFSSWLPLAMAAPTPVSSLVHSSTLVTAGVFLMIRFMNMMEESTLSFLLLISSATVILAGISALWEYDLKKIIALSTLSHIGLMMMFISIKDEWPALIHLITHSMFKSLLFMCSGSIIHMTNNTQDIRLINSVNPNNNVIMIISIFSMMGLPFLSGFYSKELMLITINSSNLSIFFTMSFMVAVMMTCSYSTRLIKYLMSGKSQLILMIHKESNYIFMSMMFGCFFSSTVGGLLVWDLLQMENLSTDWYYNMFMKELLIIFMTIGVLLGLKSTLMDMGVNTIMMTSMLFIGSFCYLPQKFMFNSSFNLFNLDIKGWSDYSVSSSSKQLIYYFKGKVNSLMNQPISINNLMVKTNLSMIMINMIIMKMTHLW